MGSFHQRHPLPADQGVAQLVGGQSPQIAVAGAGVGLGFIVFFFNEFSGALANADIIPLFAAAWAPPVVALLSGLALLCYTEDG